MSWLEEQRDDHIRRMTRAYGFTTVRAVARLFGVTDKTAKAYIENASNGEMHYHPSHYLYFYPDNTDAPVNGFGVDMAGGSSVAAHSPEGQDNAARHGLQSHVESQPSPPPVPDVPVQPVQQVQVVDHKPMLPPTPSAAAAPAPSPSVTPASSGVVEGYVPTPEELARAAAVAPPVTSPRLAENPLDEIGQGLTTVGESQ